MRNIVMTPDQVKFYTELMKSLTAFILGTGAGIYALLTSDVINSYFLIFISILCFFFNRNFYSTRRLFR